MGLIARGWQAALVPVEITMAIVASYCFTVKRRALKLAAARPFSERARQTYFRRRERENNGEEERRKKRQLAELLSSTPSTILPPASCVIYKRPGSATEYAVLDLRTAGPVDGAAFLGQRDWLKQPCLYYASYHIPHLESSTTAAMEHLPRSTFTETG